MAVQKFFGKEESVLDEDFIIAQAQKICGENTKKIFVFLTN